VQIYQGNHLSGAERLNDRCADLPLPNGTAQLQSHRRS
jgi:hypothetical protein